MCVHPFLFFVDEKIPFFLVAQSHPRRVRARTNAARAASRSSKTTNAKRKRATLRRLRRSSRKSAGDPSCPPGTPTTKTPTQCQTGERELYIMAQTSDVLRGEIDFKSANLKKPFLAVSKIKFKSSSFML